MDRQRQAGAVRVGCILLVTVFAMFALPTLFVLWKLLPAKTAASELYDYMVEQAKEAGDTPASLLKQRLVSKARELDLPIDAGIVKVELPSGRIRISASFTVPIEFPGYTYDWEFDLRVERPLSPK